jgi:pimeloyl-ACP methyl ester carboxylesterase
MKRHDWSSGIVEIAGGHIAYHRTNTSRPPLVLSHGLTDNGLCWTRVADVLAEDFHVIMLDARAHGNSSRITDGIEHDPALDLAQAIEQLGLDAPVVMGHSLGARSTARYAAMYPERVSTVILEDPPLLARRDEATMEKWRADFRKQVLQFRSMTIEQITQLGKERSPNWHDDEFPAWAESKLEVDFEVSFFDPEPWQKYIPLITAPTLLMYGEAGFGGIVTTEIAAEVRSLNPRITTTQIDGAGHNTRRENFNDYMQVVRSFLFDAH